MEDVTAILFCGGRGTRLYPVTDYYQKVMMPIGSEGKPMLEHVIDWLSNQGINHFIALIRYRANQIRRYFGDGSNWGVKIDYVLDDPSFKGTGGALMNARNKIKTKNMLIYFTDILSNFNTAKMHDFHISHGKIGTNLLDPDWMVEEGILQIDEDNYVKKIINKSDGQVFANTGISLLDDRCFAHLDEIAKSKAGTDSVVDIDLSGDLFPMLAKLGEMKSYFTKDWWLDVGSITRHKQIDDELLIKKFGGVDN